MRANSPQVILVGSSHSAGTLDLEEFLTRNRRSFVYLDYDKSPEQIPRAITQDMLPVAICSGQVLSKPTVSELAELLGLSKYLDQVYDVVIVGAGPAGLASAIYAASEGLDTLVLEGYAPGGQAGMSSRIENYMGFPNGLSGMELASLAVDQADKFGAKLAVAQRVIKLAKLVRPYQLATPEGFVNCRSIIIACGAKYNKLDIGKPYEGLGVYYSATPIEAQLIEPNDEVIVVGGGNSAGQATMFLSKYAKTVHLLVRGAGLADSMSQYLSVRIAESPNVVMHPFSQIEGMAGQHRLEEVTWLTQGQYPVTIAIGHVFVMTGAKPNVGWLDNAVMVDDKGFVITGYDLTMEQLIKSKWPMERLGRRPYLFETSLPGIFAVGDVRSGSIKRVATAAGEGGAAIQNIHRTIQEGG